jgi:lyso-ornithine lipid O-acyltransferase
MSGVFQHPLRVGFRLVWLTCELILIAAGHLFQVTLRPGRPPCEARARWLQWGSRRLLRVFNTDVQSSGSIPRQGLLVSNHLSYLDILVLSTLAPCIFVAKRDVKKWPVFGWFASVGGTLFIDRERRSQVAPLNRQLGETLDQGALVVLFPEGTSSGGHGVLPFKSSLLEPAARSSHPLSAGFIEYRLVEGDVSEEVCYWKDMTFLPHLVNLLSKSSVQASVGFSPVSAAGLDRKQLARQLHSEVLGLQHRQSERPEILHSEPATDYAAA